jgi:hypothetical protein
MHRVDEEDEDEEDEDEEDEEVEEVEDDGQRGREQQRGSKRQESREILLIRGLCFRIIHLGVEPLLEFGGKLPTGG